MELDAVLRSEVAKLRTALELAVPARAGLWSRVASFLRGLVF
jgi:hypothetical protein